MKQINNKSSIKDKSCVERNIDEALKACRISELPADYDEKLRKMLVSETMLASKTMVSGSRTATKRPIYLSRKYIGIAASFVLICTLSILFLNNAVNKQGLNKSNAPECSGAENSISFGILNNWDVSNKASVDESKDLSGAGVSGNESADGQELVRDALTLTPDMAAEGSQGVSAEASNSEPFSGIASVSPNGISNEMPDILPSDFPLEGEIYGDGDDICNKTAAALADRLSLFKSDADAVICDATADNCKVKISSDYMSISDAEEFLDSFIADSSKEEMTAGEKTDHDKDTTISVYLEDGFIYFEISR